MRFLLETHSLLWCLFGDRGLSCGARRVFVDGVFEILVSAASVWEIAIKVRLGKLQTGEPFLADLDRYLGYLGFEGLPISLAHAARAGTLRGEHRDPFDRMLISQAQSENLPIISNDRIFDLYHIQRIW